MHFIVFLQFHANHDLTWSTSVSFTKIQNPVVLCSIDSRVRQRHEAWMDSCFGSFKCPSAVSAFIAAQIEKKEKVTVYVIAFVEQNPELLHIECLPSSAVLESGG